MAHLSRRQKIAASATALVLVGSGSAAFAYWSSAGTGSGTGSTTRGDSNLSISGPITSALYPGQDAQNFTVSVKNNAANNAYVAGVTAYVTTNKDGCDSSDFRVNGSEASMASPVTLVWPATDIVGGATKSSDAAANTIQFFNKDVTQEACKGATITLHYASN